jgi:hypothetical protein
MSPSDRLVVQDDTKTLKSRRGDKKASIAVAHEILRACWHMLSTSETYREQGAEALRARTAESVRNRAIRQLERFGHKVTLEPLACAV